MPIPLLIVPAFIAALVTAGCSDAISTTDAQPATAALDHPDATGILKVLTRNGSTTYYLDQNEQPAGPEYDLISAFAAARGWDVEWQVVASTAAVLERMEQGTVHIAAAGLTHLAARNALFERGPAHTEVRQQVVCHRETQPMPASAEDLSGVELRVTANTSYAAQLAELAQQQDMRFSVDAENNTERLLAAVADGRLACTVADSTIVRVNQRFQPTLSVAFDLTQGESLGWYLAKGQSELTRTATLWMNSPEGNAAVTAMENSHYSYIADFDFVDARALNRRLDERLPAFLEEFLRAGETTGMPADLLAALSYQESHWDPAAKSPTGVRGMMMLTLTTAKDVGVTNRLDPVQSIHGGARYLADRHRRLPEHIPEPDRTFLALASYNVGRGHLLDARQLARELGKNPDSWEDMREVLPLLSDERYYPKLRYGYARGGEPVQYVRRIRNYRDVISQAFE